jgi:DNA-binding response OmpR family regulator
LKQQILVVDDAPDIVLFIESLLEDEYLIRTAYNGTQALEMVEKHRPDLILLDILMPDLDGYEVCRRVKSDPSLKHIPIILVSGMNKEDDEIIGFEVGAADYITKPLSGLTLAARVKNQLLFHRTKRELELANSEISQERETIEGIIDRMKAVNEFDDKYVDYASRSPEVNSGDMVLSGFSKDHTQYVMVADFTGHGLTAAIGGPLVSYIFYRLIRKQQPIDKVIQEINRVLTISLPVNLFMAAAIAEVSANRQSIKLWNYGMEDILKLDGCLKWHSFSSKGCALGIIESQNVEPHYVLNVVEGERFFLMSDGVTETCNVQQQQRMFGTERLKQSLLDLFLNVDPSQTELSIHDSLDCVLQQIIDYADGPAEFDDMTLLELNI